MYRETLHPQGREYIFIDEIQNIEGWEKTVNSLSQWMRQACRTKTAL
ncbi:MAG: AAA family ATPase [Candidatus Cryptobacteroides sp.]